MKTIQFKSVLFLSMITLMISSCTKDNDVEVPTAKTTIFAENFDGLAKINFSNIYQASGNSYAFNSQSFTNISDLTATNVSFQSTNPADQVFKKTTGNVTGTVVINGILTYTDNAGNPFSIKGCITGQINTGITTKGFNFIPTISNAINGDYYNPSGLAYLLSLNGYDSSFTVGSTVNTSSNQLENVIDAYLLKSVGWSIANQAGTLQWSRDSYNSDGYAKFSSYQSGEPVNVSWLISPAINMDTQDGEKLYFQSCQDGFVRNLDNSIELYVSTDYDGVSFDNASWEKVPFNFPTQNTKKYVYVDSGLIDLSSYTGTLHFAFKVRGTSSLTGGYQVDNVRVFY